MTAREQMKCTSVPGVIPEDFSLFALFARQPAHVGAVQLFNDAAKIDRYGISLRFEQQTLFARSGKFRSEEVSQQLTFYGYKYPIQSYVVNCSMVLQEKARDSKESGVTGGNQGYLLYTNGKVIHLPYTSSSTRGES